MLAPKVVITHRVHDDVVRLLSTKCQVSMNTDDVAWSCKEVMIRAKDAAALMVFMTDCIDRKFLDNCPSLRIVAGVLKGFDNFDVEACSERGVWLCTVPDRLTAATAEFTIGLLISVARNIVSGDAHVRAGYAGWKPYLYGKGLEGNTVGILGAGAVGSAVAARLRPFGCKVICFDEREISNVEAARAGFTVGSFQDVLELSDFIVVALPLTPDTHHKIGWKALSSVKNGAYLINTARGSIVDEEAVARALGEGRLAGFAADVFETEDLARTDRPLSIAQRLLNDRARTVLTPHLGSAEITVRRDAELEMAHVILECLSGRTPRGAVNSAKWKKASAC